MSYYNKIKGYIVSVDNNQKIKIEVNDEDSLNKINNLISKLKKKKSGKLPIDKECDNRFLIKVNNNTKFKFQNINYNNLSDLHGVEVCITFYYKYYNFKILVDDDAIKDKKKEVFIQGHSFIATKISNINIFNA